MANMGTPPQQVDNVIGVHPPAQPAAPPGANGHARLRVIPIPTFDVDAFSSTDEVLRSAVQLMVSLQPPAKSAEENVRLVSSWLSAYLQQSSQRQAVHDFALYILEHSYPDSDTGRMMAFRCFCAAGNLLWHCIKRWGHVPSMNVLAGMMKSGFEGRFLKNTMVALHLAELAARKGKDPVSYFNLGKVQLDWRNSSHTTVRRALKLLAWTSAKGHVNAMFTLGKVVLNGHSFTPPNATLARRYLTRAANHGHIEAMFILAEHLLDATEDTPAGLALLERAASESAHVGAKLRLAKVLVNGRAGLPKDATRAPELFGEVLEEECCFDALVGLARLLLDEEDVTDSDRNRAARLLSLALEVQYDSGVVVELVLLLDAMRGSGPVEPSPRKRRRTQ